MIKIAHRGNLFGANPENENHPNYILNAIEKGFDVEIDIWFDGGQFYLGHDKPQYWIDLNFIDSVFSKAWFHCKNIEALYKFSTLFPTAKFFWHQEDDYTLTSNGYIWTYPGKEITSKTIIVDLEKVDHSLKAYGVCSDYMI